MKPAAKIFQKVRRGVQTVAYSNLLYRKILASGDGPDRLHFTLADTWPGDAVAGQALISGQRSMFDKDQTVSLRHAGSVLRNLRAVGTDAARQMAVRLIENWMRQHNSWSEAEWAPDVLGERIAGWIGFYEFYAPAASAAFINDLTASLHRQWKHLTRVLPPSLTAVTGLRAIKGLVYGGFNFPEGEKALGIALDLLRRQLAAEILPDGGVIARNPSVQLHMLRHLIDLRSAFKAAELDVPESVRIAIQSMLPVVKFFRHADGAMALFHGSAEEIPLLIDAVLTQAETRGRALRRLPDTGYERLSAGRSLLIADCGLPPPRGYDASGHAGLLSFEFGSGKERLIVNCGAVTNANADWRAACAATAAHSTLSVEDKNACEVMASGNILCSAHLEAQRYEQDGSQYIEMTHDGYLTRYGLTHQRILGLSADGEELHGHDILTGKPGRHFTIRWHLHPLVQASLAQSGQTALIRTVSGSGWRLRIEGEQALSLSLEPSIYCGSGIPRRSLQLKVTGRTDGAQTPLIWTLAREKR